MNRFFAQISSETIKQVSASADFLQGKDAKWWFAALFIIFVGTGVLIVRWLLKSHEKNLEQLALQLDEQRKANAVLTNSLINYLTTDHVKSTVLLDQVGVTLKEVCNTMVRITAKLENHP